METTKRMAVPVGTQALILSKLYYGVLSKNLEALDIERYFSVLYFLKQNNGCSQQCICNNLAMDKTAMVKVMDYLMKAGCIERKVNPGDRREHFILLTKKGINYTNQIVKSFDALDQNMFLSVSKSDQLAFKRVLAQLRDNLSILPGNDLFFNYKKTGVAKENAVAKRKKTKR